MTAFAGSIGIIGIAAILALSNGVNGYIEKVEEDTLSSYPLTISKQDYDLSSMMGGQGAADDGSPENVWIRPTTAGGKAEGTDKIPVVTAVKDMFASVKSNDMTSFKSWLDAGGDGIDKEVNAIQYGYGVTPVVYRAGKGDKKPVRLVPNAMTEAMSGGASSAATVSMESMGTSVFNEMIDDQTCSTAVRCRGRPLADVRKRSRDGAFEPRHVGDYTLYSIGVLDINELNDLVKSAMSADGDVDTPDTGVTFTYDDALSTTFKVLSPADAYRKNDETGRWTDMSGDADFMAAKVADGLDLKIVGVVRPNETANAQRIAARASPTRTALASLWSALPIRRSSGAACSPRDGCLYGQDLRRAARRGQARRGPGQHVQCGRGGAQERLLVRCVCTFGCGRRYGPFWYRLIRAGHRPSGVGKDIDFSDIMAKAPAPDFSGIFDGLELTPEQMQQAGTIANQLFEGFLQSDQFKACRPKILTTHQSSLPHSRRILRMERRPSNAWLSSRRSGAMPWPSACSRR